MSDTDQAPRKRPKRDNKAARKTLMTWALVLLPMSLVIWPTVLLLVLTMLPTVAAWLFEREPDKHFTITIGLANLCGTMPALAALWDTGHDYDAMTLLLHDGLTWILPYCAAALGMGIYTATESITSTYYRVTAHQRILSLRRRQKALIDIWGPEVICAEYDESEAELDDEDGIERTEEDARYALEAREGA